MSNVAKSQVMNKLKAVAKGAWKRARGVEAKARGGGGGFPPNLKGLVAVCQNYKFTVTNTPKKDPYFSLTCIVKDPEEYIGRRATFMWFINESEYATVEDNLNILANDLQLLGLDMPEDIEDIVPLFADLCERGVHLVFDTGGPRKNDRRPNLFIQGLAADWPDEPQEGAGEAPERPQRGGGRTQPTKAQDNGDANDSAGEAVDTQEGDAGDEGGGDDWLPQKEEQYYYTPPKGKKTLMTVTAVDKKKRTLTLKGGKPPREFKNLSFDDPKITGE